MAQSKLLGRRSGIAPVGVKQYPGVEMWSLVPIAGLVLRLVMLLAERLSVAAAGAVLEALRS